MEPHAAGSGQSTLMPGHSTGINTNPRTINFQYSQTIVLHPLHARLVERVEKAINHDSIIENNATNIKLEEAYKLKFPVLQHIQIKFPNIPSMRDVLTRKIL